MGKKEIYRGLFFVIGGIAGLFFAGKILAKEIKKYKALSEKHERIFRVLNQWLILKQQGKCIQSYFTEKGYKTIAIYGMSYLGERLVDELRKSDVSIKYIIDKNVNRVLSGIETISPEEKLETVDAIVVTAVYYFDEIEKQLGERIKCPIISLEDIVF